MSPTPEHPALPPRPEPPRRLGDTLLAWLAWFGVARLVAGAAAVVVVAAGAYWLVRAPAPPSEARLPVADSSSGSAPEATLPPPPPSSRVAGATGVVVHVAGAVHEPGVHTLPGSARVHEAIAAAGGPTPDADLDGLNLAASLVDGQRIYVPVAGEVDPAGVGALGAPGGAGSSGPIDLNRATAAELEMLPGVGPATAGAIVDDRDRHGPFASVDDLERVPGIGPAKLAALRDLVTV